MERYPEEDFLAAWKQAAGSPKVVAAITGMTERGVYLKRDRLAKRGVVLQTIPGEGFSGPAGRRTAWGAPHPTIPQRLEVDYPEGVIVIFSDAHFWPGHRTVAFDALLTVIKTLKPRMVIANGDILDGATISRHGVDGWQTKPSVEQELDECTARMGEIEDAAGEKAALIWTQGNHDVRFERYLASNAPLMKGVPGMTLPERFPKWEHTMSCMINPHGRSPIMVKHRLANGLHAAYNNTLRAGTSIVTGHLHRLTVTTWGDYRGRRYGVDTGTLADPHGPQFQYAEDNPSPHGSGFAVLTIHEGDLLPPELCEVRGGRAFFRGAKV